MNTVRPCGCKGVRTCLQCEADFNIAKPSLEAELQQLEPWCYCPACERLFEGWDTAQVCAEHATHDPAKGIPFPGMLVKENFLSAAEGAQLIRDLDTLPWAISQSGRRKQNFGPKTNFRKRKLQNGNFEGFPASTQFIQEYFRQVPLLQDFQTIEQCSLEYDPAKGASIDPHVDDCWIWGERVVTVNCLGDAVLTLTAYDATPSPTKYNLDLVSQYEQQLIMPLAGASQLEAFKGRVIRVPMPNLSLMVMYGPARYQFEHAVLREDVQTRRVCLAYREFTPMYIDGVDREKGKENALFSHQVRHIKSQQSGSTLVQDFQTIEQCSLEYDPAKGASIDPHVDDCWIWGERVVTVNCLGDAVLTLTAYDATPSPTKYNLDLVSQYEQQLIMPLAGASQLEAFKGRVIRVPMPNLSLMVMYGPARYQFEHAVLREDVQTRRVCLAYREFTPMYIDGVDREKGKEVTRNAQHFWDNNADILTSNNKAIVVAD